MKPVTVGYGDAATWGSCTGHPLDPRTEDTPDSPYQWALDDGIAALRINRGLLDIDAFDEFVEQLVEQHDLSRDEAEALRDELNTERHYRIRSREFLAAYYGMGAK